MADPKDDDAPLHGAGGLTSGVEGQPTDKKKRDRKLAYIAIAVGAVGTLLAWLTYRNASGGSTSSTATLPTSASMTSGGGMIPGSSSDGSQSSYDQAILQALAQLTPTAPTVAPGVPGPAGIGPVPAVPIGAASQVPQGSGWWQGLGNENPIQAVGGPKGIASTWFSWLSPQAAAANPGQQRFYEPQPFIFQPVTTSTRLAPGTPQYVQSGPPVSGYHY